MPNYVSVNIWYFATLYGFIQAFGKNLLVLKVEVSFCWVFYTHVSASFCAVALSFPPDTRPTIPPLSALD